MYTFFDQLYNSTNPYYAKQISKRLSKAAEGLNIPRCPPGWVWNESLQKCEQNKEERKALAKKVVDLARKHVNDDSYFPVPESIRNSPEGMAYGANGCIGGVCSILTEAGIMEAPNWSNTDFALHAKDYGFPNKGYGLSGIKNLEPGDILQMVNDRNDQGNYYPGHAMIFLGIDENGEYEFFDNFNGPNTHKTTKWSKSRVEEELNFSNNDPKKPHSVIYKMNPYDPPPYTGNDAEISAIIEERKANHLAKLQSNLSYNYDANEEPYKGYGNPDMFPKFGKYEKLDGTQQIQEEVMQPDGSVLVNSFYPEPNTYRKTGWNNETIASFFNLANSQDEIDNLVNITGASKEDIHDSLLNVFGELGQESNWGNPQGQKSKKEYNYEKFLSTTGVGKFLGGGKRHSVGPGQIKLKFIEDDLKDKLNIHTTKDLFDPYKVTQLMIAQDLKAKDVLKSWSNQGTLGKNLGIKVNGEEPTIETLPGGVGRWSPYLRNSLYNIAYGKRGANNRFTKIGKFFGMQNIGNRSNIDPVTGDLIEPWKLDAGSYPSKVANLTTKYLTRKSTTPNTLVGPNEQDPTLSYLNSPQYNEFQQNLYKYTGLPANVKETGMLENPNNYWQQSDNKIIQALSPVLIKSKATPTPVRGGTRYATPAPIPSGNDVVNPQNLINPLNTNKMGGSINYMQGGGDSSQSAEQQQLMQIIQMYAQMKQQDPREIIQELQQLDPDTQKERLQMIVAEVQQAAQKQAVPQQQAAPMQMQRMGGQPCYNCGGMYAHGGVSGQSFNPGVYADGYSGTSSAGNYFNSGGSFVPSYGDSAYGAMMMYGGGMSEGGVVIGGVYDANPAMLQKLKAGGYTYEIVND
jgi:hypothetical protein